MKKLSLSSIPEKISGSFVEKINNSKIKEIAQKISSSVSEILSVSEIDKIVTVIAVIIFTLIPSTALSKSADDYNEILSKVISSVDISTTEEYDPLKDSNMVQNKPKRPSGLEVALMITEEFSPRFIRRPIEKLQGTIDKFKVSLSLQKKINQDPPPKEERNKTSDKKSDTKESETFIEKLENMSKIIRIQMGNKTSENSKPNKFQELLGIKGWDTSFSYNSSDKSLETKAIIDAVKNGIVYSTQIALEKDDYSMVVNMPFDSSDIERIFH